jgi:D-3-phosphoglycerate dehydrogenase / 2-oxoglutarate reductase
MEKRKILIVDKLHPAFKEAATELGYEVDDHPEYTYEQTMAVIAGYTGLAIRTKFRVDRPLLEAAGQLKFIARAGAGIDNIDEEMLMEKRLICINAPEGNRDAVAEHAIGLLLAVMNNFAQGDEQIRKGIWDREGNRGYELGGKTVAIIGYGNTGRALAKKLSGFDVQVLAYDKYHTGFSEGNVREASMEEVVKHADVLSIHIPLTRETKQMVNDEYFFHFRKPLFFINTARGEIVNTTSVLNGIQSGKILAAGLDVLEVEKLPALGQQEWFEKLAAERRIVLSPHVAGWTHESYRKISEVLAWKLKNLEM